MAGEWNSQSNNHEVSLEINSSDDSDTDFDTDYPPMVSEFQADDDTTNSVVELEAIYSSSEDPDTDVNDSDVSFSKFNVIIQM